MFCKVMEDRPDSREYVEAHLQELLLVDVREVKCLVLNDSLHDYPVQHCEAEFHCKALL